jgi:response regulator RpfG family c-di-GMP phosphodiesterase
MKNNLLNSDNEQKLLGHEMDMLRKDLDAAHIHIRTLQQEMAHKENRFREKQALLEHSMDQLGLMIEERRVTNEELERLNTLYHTNLDNLVELLTSLIAAKCRYAGDPSRKIADVAVYIAGELQQDVQHVRRIEMAALLHELGKLALSDQLLTTPREVLNEREARALRYHPMKGAGWLEKFMGLEDVAEIIRHVHENMDGSGVPDGLKGDDIPLGARIIRAAALYYDAVHHHRDLDTHSLFTMIEEMAGGALDPRLVFHLHKYDHTHARGEENGKREMRLYELEPGMTLASGIYNRQGAKLIAMDTVLTEALIAKIVHYNSIDPLEQRIFIKT